MTKSEENLLELLKSINYFETKCQHLESIKAIPPEVYEDIKSLRERIAKWGTECIVLVGKDGEN